MGGQFWGTTVILLNMGHRFGNRLRQEADLSHSSGGGENQEERRASSPNVYDNDTDFDEDQYPPAEDRYKQLEDRLNAMEVRKVPGLEFEELGLVSGVVIPQKFKVPVFAKYDGGFMSQDAPPVLCEEDSASHC